MRKAIPGFPKYEADELGNIYSERGALRHSPNGKDYMRVFLRRDGKTFTRYVHRVICETFHGPPPSPDHDAAHWDGHRGNNRASNLRWATRKENMADAFRHETFVHGERATNCVLTEAMVGEARRRALAKEPVKDIAAEMGVKDRVLADAVFGRRWKRTGEAVPAYHTRRRLTEDQVRAVRARAAAGERHVDIGRDYGISRTAVGQVHRRESYEHVADDSQRGSAFGFC